MMGPCEHGDELQSSVKGGEFIIIKYGFLLRISAAIVRAINTVR